MRLPEGVVVDDVGGHGGPAPHRGRTDLERELGVERGLVRIRWFGSAFAVFQITVQTGSVPAHVKASGYALAAGLAVFNLGLSLWLRRERDLRALRRAGVLSLVADHLFVIALVWVYSFSLLMTQWVVMAVLPIEAALRYGIRGVLGSLVAVAAAEVARDVVRLEVWGYPPEFVSSTSFRVGLLSIIGVLAGIMARNLDQERRLEQHARREAEVLLQREQEAVRRLQELDAMRADFIAITSHELRTPLTAISGFAQTMRRSDLALSDAERAEYLAVIDRQSRKLASIVEDLHFLAGVEAGTLPLRLAPVALGPTLEQLVRDDFPGDAGRVRLTCPNGRQVVADPDRLARAVGAVVGNALKFSPPDAPVDVTVVDDGTTGTSIEVADRGPGIPPEEVGHIFDPFHQVGGAMKRRQEGFGLGLYICRRLVEEMGGSVTVRTAPGEGSVFTIRLPATP